MAPRTWQQKTTTQAGSAVPSTDTSACSVSKKKDKKKKHTHMYMHTLPQTIEVPPGVAAAEEPGLLLHKVELIMTYLSPSHLGKVPLVS